MSTDAHSKAKDGQPDPVEQEDTVDARLDAAADGVTVEVEHAGYRLPLGQVVKVPQRIFDELTSGENGRLFRVSKVEPGKRKQRKGDDS